MEEAIRRLKNIKRITEYEKKLLRVQELLEKVTGDREMQVLNWMLDGYSMRWIEKKMGLSLTHIQNIKDNILITLRALNPAILLNMNAFGFPVISASIVILRLS